MNEIPKILESGEKIIWDGKPKFSAYIASAIFGALLFGVIFGLFIGAWRHSKQLGFIAAGCIFFLSFIWSILSYRVTHYAITNERAVIQSGVIGRDFRSIDYDKVQNASVDVGLIGVIFRVGTVKIFTGELIGTGGKHGTSIQPKYDGFVNVEEPYNVLKLLQTSSSRRKKEL